MYFRLIIFVNRLVILFMSKIFVVKENHFNRVAAYPKLAKKLSGIGYDCVIESDAGVESNFENQDFEENGWKITDRVAGLSTADLVISIDPLSDNDLSQMKNGAVAIGMYEPYNDDSVIDRLSKFSVNVISMDMIPRTTIAQSMDVLSSMASLSGYKAVLKAQEYYGKMMPLMMTAAGTIPPTKVLILGAGVAGLQAIATAKRLGAVVEAFDTRAAAKEEVMSLGGKFIEVEGAKDDTAAGGYAVEQSEEFLKKQRELVADRAAASNIVITTAQVRGRKAPMLIPKETLERMQVGSVLVDLAASTGGNVALSEQGEVNKFEGKTIIGESNLSDEMAEIASELFGNNVYNLLNYLTKEGKLILDPENEIVNSALIKSN